jgi:alpha-amylase
MKLRKRLTSFALSLCLVVTATAIPTVSAVVKDTSVSEATAQVQESSATNYVVDDQQYGSILQCFNWSYSGIKSNMAKIAEQGFTAVQTSPIQTVKESTAGKSAKGSWWVYYQPSAFEIETNANGTSALGTASDFKAMCDEAHKYGIRVIVDAVLNHMANQSGNDLSSTITSDIRNDSNCWYNIKENTSNWSNRYDITHKCMDGLPDLNTSNSKVQNYEIKFLKQCIDCGADGFRFDGAKHIEVPNDNDGASSDFWSVITSTITSYAQSTRGITPYYYGEVLDNTGGGQSVNNEYVKYISLTASSVSDGIRSDVNSGNASAAARSDYTFSDGSTIPAKNAVLWNESHDTYQAGKSSGVSDTAMKKTWALVGSRAYSCGMYMARPSNWNSAQLGQADVTAWADKEVKAVNEFNNAFIGESEYLSSSGSIAYNERGTTGVVIVNCSGTSTSVSLKANKMASGTYTDAISGNTFTVEGGQIKGNIGSTGIAVVYSATKSPVATISQSGGNFKTDTLSLTLGLENATSGTYQIDNGTKQSYTGTTSITIGSGVAYGSTITVKLTATGEGGTKEYSYTFKKVDPNAVRVIDFSNSHTVYLWNTAKWSTINCYSWPTGGDGAVAWPGSTMTKVDTFGGYDLYSFTIPSTDSNLIFNSGASSSKTDNLTLQTDMVVYDNGSSKWVDANTIDEDVLASKTGTASTTVTTASQPTSSNGQQTTYLYGDVNLDSSINVKDATMIQKYCVKSGSLNDIQLKASDVNNDNEVNVKDATMIQKYSVDTITSFPVGSTFTVGSKTVTTSTTVTQPTTQGSEKITITLVDGTPQGWLSDADAEFVVVAGGTSYKMSGGSGTWTVELPKSTTSITINRNNPGTTETWNSWTTTIAGTKFTATSSGEGSWS